MLIQLKWDENTKTDLKDTIRMVERELIEKAMTRTNGNKCQAARLLGMNRTTLVEKIKVLIRKGYLK